jgi:hypothetical protein
MGLFINKNGVISASGTGINTNLLLNSATLTGKNSSIVENGITTGVHNGTSSWSEAYWPLSVSASGNPLNGKNITISLDFKTTDISKIAGMYYGFGTFSSTNSRLGDTNIAVNTYTVINGTMANNQWCRIAYTYTVPTTWTQDTAYYYKIQIKTNSGADGAIMYHKKIKIEMGNYPTVWTICPNDANNISSHGFVEYNQSFNSPAKFGNSYIQATELIEI